MSKAHDGGMDGCTFMKSGSRPVPSPLFMCPPPPLVVPPREGFNRGGWLFTWALKGLLEQASEKQCEMSACVSLSPPPQKAAP